VGFGVSDLLHSSDTGEEMRDNISVIPRLQVSLLFSCREVLCNILVEFMVTMIPSRLIEMCLSETRKKVCLDEHFLMRLLFKIVQMGMLYWQCISILLQNIPSGKYKKNRWD
jgi:hypothetical protein